MNIQWYPGHMTKTKRMIISDISAVDIVVELLDARIPYSSKNPDIDKLAGEKKRIIILNKTDLTDKAITAEWKKFFESNGKSVVLADSTSGKGFNELIKISEVLMKEKKERLMSKGRLFVPTRAMIVGIPNVGKSTFINKFTGRAVTETADRPGVTRSKQWVRIRRDFELLDTPGILWPKFDDNAVGMNLAFTGAIKDEALDITELAYALIKILKKTAPENLKQRYKIDFSPTDEPLYILELIAAARGFKIKGGQPDIERSSIVLLDEFRSAKLGKISLETPNMLLDGGNNL